MDTPALFTGANAKTEFDGGFRIDEERLRRCISIIQESCTTETIDALRIRVGRTDGLTYETQRVDDVVAEDNFASERIERIAIRSKCPEFEIELEFYDGETRLRIEGVDRNAVQVLNSRLHTFLRDDVCRTRIYPKRVARIVVPIAVIITFPLMLVPMWIRQPAATSTQQALESSQVEEKLNYLIQQVESNHPGVAMMLPLILFIFVIVFMAGRGDKIFGYFFPRSVFLFGKEQQRFQDMLVLRGKLGWAIGVGFPVSFFAGLVLWLMTR